MIYNAYVTLSKVTRRLNCRSIDQSNYDPNQSPKSSSVLIIVVISFAFREMKDNFFVKIIRCRYVKLIYNKQYVTRIVIQL